MGYGVYITDYTEENCSMLLALLRIKEQEGKLTPEEGELLARIRNREAVLENDSPVPRPRRRRKEPA